MNPGFDSIPTEEERNAAEFLAELNGIMMSGKRNMVYDARTRCFYPESGSRDYDYEELKELTEKVFEFVHSIPNEKREKWFRPLIKKENSKFDYIPDGEPITDLWIAENINLGPVANFLITKLKYPDEYNSIP